LVIYDNAADYDLVQI